MTREVAEYDVVIVGGGEFFTQCGNSGIFLIQILREIKFDKCRASKSCNIDTFRGLRF